MYGPSIARCSGVSDGALLQLAIDRAPERRAIATRLMSLAALLARVALPLALRLLRVLLGLAERPHLGHARPVVAAHAGHAHAGHSEARHPHTGEAAHAGHAHPGEAAHPRHPGHAAARHHLLHVAGHRHLLHAGDL